MNIQKPYLLFLGDVQDSAFAKTAFGVRDWAREDCIAQLSSPDCRVTLSLPEMTPREAVMNGARSLVIGVAPMGGGIPENWIEFLITALEAGLDVVSGMHTRLETIPAINAAAVQNSKQLINIRHCTQQFPIANGQKRTGKRILTVGTDCAVGKKYTALAIEKAMRKAGVATTVRATGQTGIIIAGSGIPIDAVISDFVAGAAETLSPNNNENHWDVIEGQGSLFHPAYAGVSLGLLHGSQPDFIVLCHNPQRTHIHGYPEHPLPGLVEAIQWNLEMGKRTNPHIRCAGVSLNTNGFSETDRHTLLAEIEAECALPAVDPIVTGVDKLVAQLLPHA